MGNKVKYNLKNIHATKMTETVTDGVAAFTYEKPKAVPGAVSISLDAEGESSPFYADGIVYFRSVTNNGNIPPTIEDWLDQFDMFSIYETLPEILKLWGENMVAEVEAKKNFAQVSGK